MTNLTGVIRKLRKERQRVHGEMERLNAGVGGSGKPRRSGRKAFSRTQGAEANVSGRSQENCGSPARTLGKMEEKQANQVKAIAIYALVFNALRRIEGAWYLLVIMLLF